MHPPSTLKIPGELHDQLADIATDAEITAATNCPRAIGLRDRVGVPVQVSRWLASG